MLLAVKKILNKIWGYVRTTNELIKNSKTKNIKKINYY